MLALTDLFCALHVLSGISVLYCDMFGQVVWLRGSFELLSFVGSCAEVDLHMLRVLG